MSSAPNQIVVDVGGGNSCEFARFKDRDVNPKIIAVDLSAQQMGGNNDVDERRISDVTRTMPFENEEVDIIVSKSVLEHLRDTESFMINCKRVLKPDGYFIHLFPCKWAPFSTLNRILPNALSKVLLRHLRPPEQSDRRGFPAFYDKCDYRAFTSLLEKHGFQIVQTCLSYYQSTCFDFCAPLFIISSVYEMLVERLGIRGLCACILVVARKRHSA